LLQRVEPGCERHISIGRGRRGRGSGKARERREPGSHATASHGGQDRTSHAITPGWNANPKTASTASKSTSTARGRDEASARWRWRTRGHQSVALGVWSAGWPARDLVTRPRLCGIICVTLHARRHLHRCACNALFACRARSMAAPAFVEAIVRSIFRSACRFDARLSHEREWSVGGRLFEARMNLVALRRPRTSRSNNETLRLSLDEVVRLTQSRDIGLGPGSGHTAYQRCDPCPPRAGNFDESPPRCLRIVPKYVVKHASETGCRDYGARRQRNA
jgi:hypothetical protein